MPRKLLKGFPIIQKTRYNFKISRFFLLLGFLLGLTFLLSPASILPQYPKEGEFSQKNIKSPYVFYYEDKDATTLKQKEAASCSMPVYSLDITVVPAILKDVSEFFAIVEKIKQDDAVKPSQAVLMVNEKIENLNISNESLRAIIRYPKLFEIESDVCGILSATLERGVTAVSKERIMGIVSKNILLQVISSSGVSEKTILKEEFFAFAFMDKINNIDYFSSIYPKILSSKCVHQHMFELLMHYLKPNLSFNQKATEKNIKETVKNVSPALIHVEKGEKIIGDGERVDRVSAVKLKELNKYYTATNTNTLLGFLILLYSLIIIGTGYIYKYQPDIVTTKNLLMLGVIILIAGALGKTILCFDLPIYAMPMAAISIVLSILFNEEFAVFITLFLSILMGFLIGDRLEFVLFFLAGGLSAIYTISSSSRMLRDILRLGVIIAIANAIIIIGYAIIKQDVMNLGHDLFWGCLINAGISTMLAIVGLLYLEKLFNITTNFQLFELSDVNTPLMKKLLLEAPGTYHHCLLVGNMAEAAATEVKANAILCRVGGYYHDIGKIIRPIYFAENQISENKHEDINPSLSASVIKSHIKDGMEIAREYHLPSKIIDIIQQHHGTTLLTYFYQAQKQRQEDASKSEFKYPGPKPQHKEAAIVMLSDSVEAASRSLSKPTAVRIEEMVKKIIDNYFTDGEFDECDLTLKELTRIGNVLTRLLTTMYHSRVEYPEADEETESK
ncbi:HDIG domain-containing protein [bacterium]|nr:HDIG domain-containing protein [bacterium]MBU1754397.1 HDIG domain-containing protein [bacterium]